MYLLSVADSYVLQWKFALCSWRIRRDYLTASAQVWGQYTQKPELGELATEGARTRAVRGLQTGRNHVASGFLYVLAVPVVF